MPPTAQRAKRAREGEGGLELPAGKRRLCERKKTFELAPPPPPPAPPLPAPPPSPAVPATLVERAFVVEGVC